MHVSLKWCYVIREKKKSKDKPNRRERAQAHNTNEIRWDNTNTIVVLTEMPEWLRLYILGTNRNSTAIYGINKTESMGSQVSKYK